VGDYSAIYTSSAGGEEIYVEISSLTTSVPSDLRVTYNGQQVPAYELLLGDSSIGFSFQQLL